MTTKPVPNPPSPTPLHLFAEALHQTGAIVLITDADGHILYANTAFEKFYGFRQAEILGQKPNIVKSGKHHQIFYEDLWTTIKGGQIWHGHLTNRRKDGSLVDVLATISPIIDADGEIRHFCGIQHHIDGKIEEDQDTNKILLAVSRTMRSARTRSELAQTVVQKICAVLGMQAAAIGVYPEITTEPDREPEQIYILGGAGLWEKHTGKMFEPPSLIPLPAWRKQQPYIIPDIRRHDPPLNLDLAGGVETLALFPLNVKGTYIGMLSVGRTGKISQQDQETLSALSVMVANALYRQILHEDLQEQMDVLRATQEQIIHTEKLAAMGTLVAGIAHELNNPLTSILLYAQMALQHLEDHSLRHDLEQIEAQAQRMGAVIRGMLDFVHPDSRNKTLLPLRQIIDNVLLLLTHEIRLHKVNIHTDISPDLPPVSVNEGQMQQVFVNLLMNAFQAMEQGAAPPEIRIAAWVDSPKAQEPPSLHIIIQNNGPAIAEDVMPYIFDPFFTTKQRGEGTGLGLSISHGIVTRHGGKLWAKNLSSTRGVQFHILLPIAIEEEEIMLAKGYSEEAAAFSASLPAQQQSARILLVDDEPDVITVFQRILSKQGYQVETTSSGRQALELLQRASYDLVLCDIQMPDLNGIELYNTLKATRPEVLSSILFISGDAVSKPTRAFLETLPNRLIHKPIELNRLTEVVAQALAARRSQPHEAQRAP